MPRSAAAGAAALAVLAWACPALGQQDNPPNVLGDPLASMEELVVTGRKPGDPADAEALYEAQLRDRLVKELEELQRLEEEQAWRAEISPPGDPDDRLRLGYDPVQEMEMRRASGFNELPTEREKPATVIRGRF